MTELNRREGYRYIHGGMLYNYKTYRSLAEASYNGDRELSLESTMVASHSTDIRQSSEATISSWTNLLKPSVISLKLFQPRKTTCGNCSDGDRFAKDGNSTSTHIRVPRATGNAILGLSSRIYGCPCTDGQLPWYGIKTSNQ